MSDTEIPETTGEQTQDAVNPDVTPDAPQANNESQEAPADQNGGNDADTNAQNGEAAPVEGDAGATGDGGAADEGGEVADTADSDVQQPAAEGEERQPTPAVASEEPSQECKEDPEIPEPEKPEDEPTAEPAEPEEEPTQEPEEAQPEQTSEPQEQQESSVSLTEEQMKRCRHLFDRKAVNGRLDLKGFKLLCRLMGEVLSAEDADRMFQEGDRDDNGTIEFDEFCRLYCAHSQEEQSRKTVIMESIDKLFPGMDGKPVELKKVKNLLLKMQRPDLDMRLVREKSDLNSGDIHRLVSSMDKDGNGLISKQEFVDTLCKHLDHV